MKLLITGMNGQLGHDLMIEAFDRGHDCLGTGRSEAYSGIDRDVDSILYTYGNFLQEVGVTSGRRCFDYKRLDIEDPAMIEDLMAAYRPDAVIHCASWTQVDKAEDPALQELVYRANHKATELLAQAAHRYGAKFMYISTDYVFDGRGEDFFEEDTGLSPETPLSVYGKSKLMGELAAREVYKDGCGLYICRVAWSFGSNGKNFVKTIFKVGQENPLITVVNDQLGRPTYTKDAARLMIDMIETDKYGTYHVTNTGDVVSRYEFVKEIFRIAGITTEVRGISTEEYDRRIASIDHISAPRPKNSRLALDKIAAAGFKPLPDWRDAVERYVETLR